VNEPSEATHYQIELTSRQVLTALAVLLTCLFAAFFAGVWIGRNAAAEAAAFELASAADGTRGGEKFDFFSKTTLPPGNAGPAGAAAGDENTPPAAIDDDDRASRARRELDFGPDPDDQELEPIPDALFDEPPTDQAADSLEPPEEMGRGGRQRRAAARAAAAGASEDETAPAAEEEADAEVDDEPAAPPAAPPPAAPAAPPTAPPAAPAESGFHIQVLATSDQQKAAALVERLVDADFKAFLVPSNEGGRMVYRVRVGPFPDRALATRQAAELESRWGLDSWISPGSP
jgi:cell division septation protein DedD